MGRDKAFIVSDGQTLLSRAIATVVTAGAGEVLVSGRPDTDYEQAGYPVLTDLEPGSGPLGGIERGLRAALSPLILVLAVDMPRMSPALLKRLAAASDDNTGVVPRVDGVSEPLAAIYPKRCHAIALEFLQTTRRAVRDFAAQCERAGAVRYFDVPGADRECFANWNEPAHIR